MPTRTLPLVAVWLFFLPIFIVGYATAATAAAESYSADYYTNVSLPCNFTRHNLTYPGIQVPFKKYWILPNATILSDYFLGDGKFAVTRTPYDLQLFIRNIDDSDYGVYHCIMIWNNWDYQLGAIRVGLNEDGPYYKKLLEQFERNVIIGCASSGGVVLLIVIGCIVCRCRNRKKEVDEPVPAREISVYSMDYKNRQKKTYGYEVNNCTDMDEDTRIPEPLDHTEEQYACVNKASVRATHGDCLTLQSAHL